MAKEKSQSDWLDALGIDKTCRLVGIHCGMVVLTKALDGDEHTLWYFDAPQATGDRVTMRNLYADHMVGHWLEKYYRA